MSESRNVQIPLPLFKLIILFFECLDVSGYELPAVLKLDAILTELRDKQRRLNLHAAYSAAVLEKDHEQRRSAYAAYAKLKMKH